MLSLMSSNMPTLTGTRWSENCVIGCACPFSATWKSSFVRPIIRRLLASTTVTVTVTVSMPLRNGGCAAATKATMRVATKGTKNTKRVATKGTKDTKRIATKVTKRIRMIRCVMARTAS